MAKTFFSGYHQHTTADYKKSRRSQGAPGFRAQISLQERNDTTTFVGKLLVGV